MDSTADSNGFRPPYLSFQTFWSFIEELVARPLPKKLDRSVMRHKSGSDQANLAVALRAFGLIDDAWFVTGLDALSKADEEGRVHWLAQQIRVHYGAQMKVSEENGTENQLRDSFKEAFGLESADTIRKSMTFFLHAARKAGIETSHYFPTTRPGSGAPGTAKPRRAAPKRKPPADTPREKGPDKGSEGGTLSVAGDVYTLTMASGPVVTFAVQMNVMTASVEDRDFIFQVIDKLRGYGEASKPSGSADGGAGPSTSQEASA